MQFSDLVFILVGRGFKLSSLAVKPKLKLAKGEAHSWLSHELSGYPPYYAILYSSDRSGYAKIYSSGVLLANSPIESLIVEFIERIYSYKRVRRPMSSNILSDHFENTYFSLTYSRGLVNVLLKSRFESLKSYWFTNRKQNCLYLVDDELTVLRDLCKTIMPETVECYFNLPLSDKCAVIPVLKPGIRPLFKGRVGVEDFVGQIDNLMSRPFPRWLKGLRSFVLPENSKLSFFEPRSRLDLKGIQLLFEDLREYCFDSFHLTDSFHAMT